MKQTRLLMGMPIIVEIVDKNATGADINAVFDYFTYVDETFSTYKKTSEISQINTGKLSKKGYSSDMRKVLQLCEQTNKDSNGYFNISHNGKLDPSGLVKGWAIQNAAKLLKKRGFQNFYIDAGGDIQVAGRNSKNQIWTVGIRNPFNRDEIVKVLRIDNRGVATSGTCIRGQHIYNPYSPTKELTEIVSLTVIGNNIYEADKFATAAFAMEQKGIYFIENLPEFEGYMIDKNGIATYTSGFEKYVLPVNNKSVPTIQM